MTGPRKSALYGDINDLRRFEQIPLETQFPQKTCYGLIREAIVPTPDAPAVAFLESGEVNGNAREWTFRELLAEINRIANLLRTLAIEPDHAVSIVLPTRLESHSVFWAVQAVCIANPINPHLDAYAIADIIARAGSSVLVIAARDEDAQTWSKLGAIMQKAPTLRHLLVVSRGGLNSSNAPTTDIPFTVSMVDCYVAAAAQSSENIAPGPAPDGCRPAAYFHTGGTTGNPKIAVLDDVQMAFSVYAAAAAYNLPEPHVVLSGLPLYHIFGALLTALPSWCLGGKVVHLTERGYRDADVIANFWRHVERFRGNAITCVPTVLYQLLQVPVEGSDVRCFQAVFCGGAPLPAELRKRMKRKFDVRIAEGYGLTETAGGVARQIPSDRDSNSENVGFRLPYSQIRIVELDGTRVVRDCGPDEPGILIVKGPQVFRGYLDEEHEKGAWTDDRWFITGDRAERDASEVVKILGRVKDLIIRAGHNIDPAMIEEVLLSHPAVNEAIAVGQPDAYAGELPCAYVVSRSGFTVGSPELIAYCRARISDRAATPVYVEILAEIPKTAVGKHFRPALRDAAAQRILRKRLADEGIQASLEATPDAKVGTRIIVVGRAPQLEQARQVLADYALSIDYRRE